MFLLGYFVADVVVESNKRNRVLKLAAAFVPYKGYPCLIGLGSSGEHLGFRHSPKHRRPEKRSLCVIVGPEGVMHTELMTLATTPCLLVGAFESLFLLTRM